METDAPEVLKHGVELGQRTYRDFLAEAGWPATPAPKLICHQVGSAHRQTVLRAMGVPLENDYSTFEYLGNIGTVSLPITAALAEERGWLDPGSGQRVAMCGIGSGLNCVVLGVEW